MVIAYQGVRVAHSSGSSRSAPETGITEPVVCVIDPAALMRTRLKELLESIGLKVLLFDSPTAFLQSNLGACSCLVLDVCLAEMSGLNTAGRTFKTRNSGSDGVHQ